jgi:hypothetical protein
MTGRKDQAGHVVTHQMAQSTRWFEREAPGRLNVTACLSRLVRDIVAKVPALGAVDPDRVLVFGRAGRADALGPYATCHSLTLPDSEPGYFYWRDAQSGRITRRTEWFVSKSPAVRMFGQPIDYLISFSLPRFFDQALVGTHKEAFYPGMPAWVAKLDTVVHELYHIDPTQPGIRQLERADGTPASSCHTPEFFEQVALMVREYLASAPDPALLDFLQHDFATLEERHGDIAGLTFRGFPSFPRRFRVALEQQPSVPALDGVPVVPLGTRTPVAFYGEHDLQLRIFLRHGTTLVAGPAARTESAKAARPEVAAAPVGSLETLDAHHAA